MILFLDNYTSLADNNGILATSSLGNLLRAVGENPTEEELQDLISKIDEESTGYIKFPDFLSMMASKLEQDIREVFAIFVNDGNGNIYELRQVMINMGEEEVCKFPGEEADTDGDGCINYEEFVSMMKSAGSWKL